MSGRYPESIVHEQTYFLGELESLGFTSIQLNEFNDNRELRNLVDCIKENFLQGYVQADMQCRSVFIL
jgi:hypothetical protein